MPDNQIINIFYRPEIGVFDCFLGKIIQVGLSSIRKNKAQYILKILSINKLRAEYPCYRKILGITKRLPEYFVGKSISYYPEMYIS